MALWRCCSGRPLYWGPSPVRWWLGLSAGQRPPDEGLLPGEQRRSFGPSCVFPWSKSLMAYKSCRLILLDGGEHVIISDVLFMWSTTSNKTMEALVLGLDAKRSFNSVDRCFSIECWQWKHYTTVYKKSMHWCNHVWLIFYVFILQKIQTPLSESKKVTFGLKNNKTAGKKSDAIGWLMINAKAVINVTFTCFDHNHHQDTCQQVYAQAGVTPRRRTWCGSLRITDIWALYTNIVPLGSVHFRLFLMFFNQEINRLIENNYFWINW